MTDYIKHCEYCNTKFVLSKKYEAKRFCSFTCAMMSKCKIKENTNCFIALDDLLLHIKEFELLYPIDIIE